MEHEDILLEQRIGAIAKLVLNRPAARNSLSLALLERIYSALDALSADRNVHVIVISGNGPAFCAGHDLKEMTAARQNADKGRAFFEETMQKCASMMTAIVKCPKPVIAQIHGIATAAGCQLVASCDLAIASSAAQFATPGVNIGLFCSTPMVALSRNISRKAAMEMLLTGRMIDAREAVQFGLVNKLTEPDNLEEASLELANLIASKAPETLKIGKEAFYNQAEMELAKAYEYSCRVMVENMMNPDAEEGIDAFIKKRPANWQSL